jgi:hypothetical protein
LTDADSLSLFDEVLIIDPDAVHALLQPANAHRFHGSLNDAQADFERCTQLRTNGVRPHLLLAQTVLICTTRILRSQGAIHQGDQT